MSHCRSYFFKFNTFRVNNSRKISLQEPDLENTTKQRHVQNVFASPCMEDGVGAMSVRTRGAVIAALL